ncbi:MAG TPA: hypothetical protein VMM60_03400 [Ilumatobacter sp.]|nr:hypothetical protein [Ilumatobacter sp.]
MNASEDLGPGADYLEDVRRVARAFAGEAFEALRREKVLPRSAWAPFVAVGRDYFGDSIRGSEHYTPFEVVLKGAWPARFEGGIERSGLEFPATYIFSFLEACIARCCYPTEDYSAGADGVTRSIDELVDVLTTDSTEVACCRVVTHLATVDDKPMRLGGVEIIPSDSAAHHQTASVLSAIDAAVPSARRAYSGEPPFVYDPPTAIIILRRTTSDEPYAHADKLSGDIERFLLLIRLLFAGTVQSRYEVVGASSLVSRMNSDLRRFEGGHGWNLIRRTIVLDAGAEPSVVGLGAMLDAVEIRREGMLISSFDMAVRKFNRSHVTGPWIDQIVDLATGLEACLAGNKHDDDGLTLKLKHRAAVLLATTRDPAPAIFKDIGLLYGLRSTLVHGGNLKEAELRKIIAKLSTVPDDAPFGTATAHAVDRLRDLVRRCLLARVCLASGPDPLWPFTKDVAVDYELSDELVRVAWRDRFHERLTSIASAGAWDRPRVAVDFTSPTG